ncbi:MAG: hypothetical protein CVU49_00195 [Candidatus Cloacimonetes bacterium HGW-Cloacimonetes-2]|nr:MAG: hypothetical protein CVU49_00195 [Candidatus Cloacimonetes bacterium HGW-Cloacimonetes-2]
MNNIGLPGSDITQASKSKYVLFLGNSFIRALQYDGDKIAAGILQKRISSKGYQVINAGSSGFDPYVLWFSANLFERYYEPAKVVLVYETFSRLEKHMGRHTEPLDFSLPRGFGTQIRPSKARLYYNYIRGHSSYFNLIGTLNTNQEGAASPIDNSGKSLIHPKDPLALKTLALLQETLLVFSSKYGDRFVFISLMRDNPYSDQLADYCDKNDINYLENLDITRPENLIDGKGHFNLRGNKLLADYVAFEVMGVSD